MFYSSGPRATSWLCREKIEIERDWKQRIWPQYTLHSSIANLFVIGLVRSGKLSTSLKPLALALVASVIRLDKLNINSNHSLLRSLKKFIFLLQLNFFYNSNASQNLCLNYKRKWKILNHWIIHLYTISTYIKDGGWNLFCSLRKQQRLHLRRNKLDHSSERQGSWKNKPDV